MAGIQDLIAAAAQAGIGGGGGASGGAPGGMPMAQAGGGGGDLGSQLMGLVGKVASSPGGAQLMQGAIQALMGGGGAQGGPPQGGGMPPLSPNSVAGPNRGEMGPTDRVQPDGGGAQLYDMVARGRTPPGEGMTTEQELEKARQDMGATKSGDPSADGNFPSSAEIKALQDGKIDPKEFDAKWGKGAAREMMMQDTEGDGDGKDSEGQGDSDYK